MTDFFKFRNNLEEAIKVKQAKKPSEVYEDELQKPEDDPCWEGYVQVGTKMENGKEVPNCVPMEEARKQMDEASRKTEKELSKLMTKALDGKQPKSDYTSEIANNGDFVVKDGGGRVVGRIKKGDFEDPMKENVNESKVTDDHWAIVKRNGSFYTSKSEIKKIVKPSKNPPSQGTVEKHGGDSAVRVGELKKDLKGMRNTDKLMKQLSESYYDYPDYGPIGASEMAQTQLHFIKYAANDITRCLKSGCPMPEWYQNKLAKIEGDMEGLYSYMKGKTRKMKAHQADRYSMSMGRGMYEETLTEAMKISGYYRKDPKVPSDLNKLNKNSPLETLIHAYLEAAEIASNSDYGSTEYDFADTDMEYLSSILSKRGVSTRDLNKLSQKFEKDGKYPVIKESNITESKTMEAQSGDKEAYTKFFNKALKKFGVKSPAELKGDKEKEFYDYVDKNWKSDDEMKNESYINEVLKPSDDVSTWIEDFYKSDAPQFKGKDKEERREMAVAAWLEARREAGYKKEFNENRKRLKMPNPGNPKQDYTHRVHGYVTVRGDDKPDTFKIKASSDKEAEQLARKMTADWKKYRFSKVTKLR